MFNYPECQPCSSESDFIFNLKQDPEFSDIKNLNSFFLTLNLRSKNLKQFPTHFVNILKLLSDNTYQKINEEGYNIAKYVALYNSTYQLNLPTETIITVFEKSNQQLPKQTLAALVAVNNKKENLKLPNSNLYNLFLKSDLNFQNSEGNNLAMIIAKNDNRQNPLLTQKQFVQLISLSDFSQVNSKGENIGMLVTKHNFENSLYLSGKQLEKIIQQCNFKRQDAGGNSLAFYTLQHNYRAKNSTSINTNNLLSSEAIMMSIDQSDLSSTNIERGYSVGAYLALYNNKNENFVNLPSEYVLEVFKKTAEQNSQNSTFNIGTMVMENNSRLGLSQNQLMEFFKTCFKHLNQEKHNDIMYGVVNGNDHFELNLSADNLTELIQLYLERTKNPVNPSLAHSVCKNNGLLKLDNTLLTTFFEQCNLFKESKVRVSLSTTLAAQIAKDNKEQNLDFNLESYMELISKQTPTAAPLGLYALYFYITNPEVSNITISELNQKYNIESYRSQYNLKDMTVFYFNDEINSRLEAFYDTLDIQKNIEQKPKSKIKPL